MKRCSFRHTIGLAMLLCCAIGAQPAAAQGNGRPKAPKTTPSAPSASSDTTPSATSATTPAVVTTSSFRQYGTWLDDASVLTRGDGYVSVGVGHWRLNGMSQTNMPMLGAGVGVTDRLQVGASVPFYRVHVDGTTASGVDDVYVGAKYMLVDPTLTLSEFGLAINPMVEILSAGATDRVHFALPVSMELRRAPFRVYGSAGYFTRGSVFAGGAFEWTSPRGLMLTGALTQSHSVKEDPALDQLAVGSQRTDVTATAAYPFAGVAAGWVSVGRTLTSVEEGGTSLALSGGISIGFASLRMRP